MLLYRSQLKGTGGKPESSYSVSVNNALYTKAGQIRDFYDNATFNESVIIGNGVMGTAYMFNGCTNFNQPVVIPNNIVNCLGMFLGCSKFNQTVELPNAIDISSMFSGCSSYNQLLNIPDSVVRMSSTFRNCTNFNQPVNIPNNVIDCISVFSGCTNLNKPINIPTNVTNCSFMFNWCTNFNQPVFVAGNLYQTFNECRNFDSAVTIGNNTVGSAYRMFYNCVKFNKPLDLGNTRINNITYLLADCSLFNSQVILPDVQGMTSLGVFMNTAFNQDVIIPNNLIEMNYMFRDCKEYSRNIYVKGTVEKSIYNIFQDTNVQKRKNIFFNIALNNVFNHIYWEGSYLTWLPITNGYYNSTANIYCYYNYSG